MAFRFGVDERRVRLGTDWRIVVSILHEPSWLHPLNNDALILHPCVHSQVFPDASNVVLQSSG